MKVIYYMPVFLKAQALSENNKDLKHFCEIFKVVSPNACIIDRTNSLNVPFDYEILYPIPNRPESISYTFGEVCIERAKHILETNNKICLLYSGGLDSTVVLLSFYLAIKEGIGSFDQIEIGSSPYSIIENPVLWHKFILPNFKVDSINNTLNRMGQINEHDTRYVMGENADQLFGSDILLSNFHLFTVPLTKDNILKFLKDRKISQDAFSYLMDSLWELYIQCPRKLSTMADLIWWLNFSCKWQSVSLRTLCFTNFLNLGSSVSILDKFETFFNTPKFQILSLYTDLAKWGEIPTNYNYKLASRDFIGLIPELSSYKDNKIKVPSLYRVLTSESYKHNALGIKEGNIYPLLKIPTHESK